MLIKPIMYFGQLCLLVCDGRCSKAWGINSRPCRQLSDNPDDYESLADDELGEAPADPGTYEAGHAKPVHPGERLNRWCARECERGARWPVSMGQLVEAEGLLIDWSKRVRNLATEAHGQEEASDV
jgi:hypothetical protein